VVIPVNVPVGVQDDKRFGADELANGLKQIVGQPGLRAEIRVEVAKDAFNRQELTILLLNTSPKSTKVLRDTNLYECVLEVSGLATEPLILEALPDSFRYDRQVAGYGVNCGIKTLSNGSLRTVDCTAVDRRRPRYWNVDAPPPDLGFKNLAQDPIPSLRQLLHALDHWGTSHWSPEMLDEKSQRDAWSAEMREEAGNASKDFVVEKERISAGLRLLEEDPQLLRSFKLMNEAIAHSAQGKYLGWRPFQMGFLLANLASISSSTQNDEDKFADVVWFATGGGKTETYLGLLVTAAIYDRLRGKTTGITAWSRFPLRMLSLQQTQRFADAFAGAELSRQRAGIPGQPFSVGFLVGRDSTPNAIRIEPTKDEPDPDDDDMPARYQVLTKCPFCHQKNVAMAFDRSYWCLEHRCANPACPWLGGALPFYVVDEEIFRFLPTIIVGTLDKAASIALQQTMRGLVGPPLGLCPLDRHGFTYSPRNNRPTGCLVPGCDQDPLPLPMGDALFGMSFRLQDELHLLRDSLGAVDAHYETLLDHLQSTLTGRPPKILASSATLTGYDKQVKVLYKRSARVFPVPGPSSTEGFWTSDSEQLARRFLSVAPRGVTLEYTIDRMLTEIQINLRRLKAEPTAVCLEAGVDQRFAGDLLSLYGTNLVYGNTLRDLDAASRSLETQISVEGTLNTASLTGKVGFEEVRSVLERLDRPEPEFVDRLHIVTASSMMSHGVDIDRLNVMLVLGTPLTTAEFIQTTARVGRRWPGLVFLLHKIARERDASVFRNFTQFVEQGDRFVEAVPITRRSRRVLERTIAGIELSRILIIHEPRSKGKLTLVTPLRKFFAEQGIDSKSEAAKAIEALALDDSLDELLKEDLRKWFSQFFRNLNDPAGNFRVPADLSPTGKAMLSLRDVEEQAPIFGSNQ
jgi:hypothetical protein